MTSTEFKSPIVDSMVLEIISKIKKAKLVEEQRYRIDADIVPKFSMKPLMKNENLLESIFVPIKQIEISVTKEEKPEKIILPVEKPIIKKVPIKSAPPRQPPIPQKPVTLPKPNLPPQISPVPSTQEDLGDLLKTKLGNLLRDHSIELIECLGEGSFLNVVSRGIKHKTDISLTSQEIKVILEIVSTRSRIPLQKGVFRVVISNWLFNAIISEEVGTRFLLKKLRGSQDR